MTAVNTTQRDNAEMKRALDDARDALLAAENSGEPLEPFRAAVDAARANLGANIGMLLRTKLVAPRPAHRVAPPAAANDNNPLQHAWRPAPTRAIARPITATPFVLRDPRQIEPRAWLYADHLARKFMSATFGAGGGGKSSSAITDTMAMVTGRDLVGHKPDRALRVWYVNLEDPRDEIERRFAAVALHFGITADQIGDRLYADSGREQSFVVMKQDGRNTKVCEPVVGQIIAEAKARQIDAIVVDPFVSTHEVEENDNSRIQQVAALWVRIADEANCAVELVHHIAKGNAEVTADSGRGAGALKDKARSVRVLNPMSEAEATSIGIGKEDAASYFRIDMGKANMAKRGGSQWRHFASVSLGNGRKTLLGIPQGSDDVGVVEAWKWPAPSVLIDSIEPDMLDKIRARINAGSFRESEQSAEWAGHVVGEVLGIDTSDAGEKKRVKRMISAWVAAGELAVEMRPDARRTPRKHIVLPRLTTSKSEVGQGSAVEQNPPQ